MIESVKNNLKAKWPGDKKLLHSKRISQLHKSYEQPFAQNFCNCFSEKLKQLVVVLLLHLKVSNIINAETGIVVV